MDVKGYTVVIQPLPEDEGGGFMAYAPDLPGCMADGDTVESAVADLCDAMKAWVVEASRQGWEVPAPNSLSDRLRQEREQISNLLAAQEKLIRQQEAVIKKQDKGLKEARSEIEKIRAGILHLLDCDPDQEKPFSFLDGGFQASVASLRKKEKVAH